MKKIYLAALALAIGSLSIAQKGVPKYGLKAGVNFATITDNFGSNDDFKVGFHAGALAHIHVSPAFSLQPEVYYSTQGAKYPLNGGGTGTVNLGYINIPVLLQYNFSNGFRLQGGPQLGIITSAKNKVGNLVADISGNYKTLDFSVPLGVSYLGYSGFGVDARYNIGISNISSLGGNLKRHNGVIQFGFFYLFDHKHKTLSTVRKRR